MGKKVYHIVDPETGEVVDELRADGFSQLLYRAKANDWKKKFKIAVLIALLLFVLFAALWPVWESLFPNIPGSFLSTVNSILSFIAALMLLRLAMILIIRFAKLTAKEQPDLSREKHYHVVDPNTGKVVDKISGGQDKRETYKTTRIGRLALAFYRIYRIFEVITFISVGIFLLVPYEWKYYAAMAFFASFVICYISELIAVYLNDKIK